LEELRKKHKGRRTISASQFSSPNNDSKEKVRRRGEKGEQKKRTLFDKGGVLQTNYRQGRIKNSRKAK